ncbi:MAG: OST-HTH/LOTUS domain-containing protein, partial [Lysobacterales bacterium]
AHLGAVGSNVVKQSPEFDSRNYGYAKLSALVAATNLFDAEEREVGESRSKAVYVRDKRQN